jgi:hypothetical protein
LIPCAALPFREPGSQPGHEMGHEVVASYTEVKAAATRL